MVIEQFNAAMKATAVKGNHVADVLVMHPDTRIVKIFASAVGSDEWYRREYHKYELLDEQVFVKYKNHMPLIWPRTNGTRRLVVQFAVEMLW